MGACGRTALIFLSPYFFYSVSFSSTCIQTDIHQAFQPPPTLSLFSFSFCFFFLEALGTLYMAEIHKACMTHGGILFPFRIVSYCVSCQLI